jgi:hypothetical protein
MDVLDRIARRTERSGGARIYERRRSPPRQKIAKSAVIGQRTEGRGHSRVHVQR